MMQYGGGQQLNADNRDENTSAALIRWHPSH